MVYKKYAPILIYKYSYKVLVVNGPSVLHNLICKGRD